MNMGLTRQLAASRYDFQSMDRADARVQGCNSMQFSISFLNRDRHTQRCGSGNTRVNTQDQSCFFGGREKSLCFNFYVFFMFVHP